MGRSGNAPKGWGSCAPTLSELFSGDEMKKKLLAIAVLGAISAPALADVTITGTVNAGPYLGRSNDGSSASANPSPAGNFSGQYGGTGGSTYGLLSNYSNMNIRSEEDIGNGNKVVFNFQFDISGTASGIDNTGAVRNRNSFLGLEGGWGALKWGTNENVYEKYQYQSDPLDGAAGTGGNLQMLGTPGGAVFTNVNCNLSGGGGCGQFYRRTENTIWYQSPDWGGFTFEINHAMPGGRKNFTGDKDNPTIWSLGGKYKPADLPFFVDVAYERHTDYNGLSQINPGQNATNSTDTGMQVGGGVTFGDFTLYLRAEQLKYKSDGVIDGFSEWKRNAYMLGAKLVVPTGYVAAQLGLAQDAKAKTTGAETFNGDKTGATMFALGYYHNLSKQTQVQAVISAIRNKDNANYLVIGGTNGTRGADHTAVYLGLKHSF